MKQIFPNYFEKYLLLLDKYGSIHDVLILYPHGCFKTNTITATQKQETYKMLLENVLSKKCTAVYHSFHLFQEKREKYVLHKIY